MKLLYSISITFICALNANSQVFWTEDFGTGCNQGQLATAYTSTNGAWTIASTGTNDNYANTFFISANERGLPVGSCGDVCGGNNDATLHLGSVALPLISLPADNGATYLSGGICGFGYCATTNKRVESPVINCSGKTSVGISFTYMEGGDGTIDDASLWYSADGGGTWALLHNMAKTASTTCSPQGLWTSYFYQLPASANNNPTIKIGFNWVNDDDGNGTDPSLAVDNITLSTPLIAGIKTIDPSEMQVYVLGKSVMIKSSNAVELAGVRDIVGRTINSSINNNTINLEDQVAGIYFIILRVNGKIITKKVFIE